MKSMKIFFRSMILLAFTGLIYVRVINQIVFAAVALLCVVCEYGNMKVKKSTLIATAAVFLCTLIALITTGVSPYNSNMPLYYVFWILYALYFLDNYTRIVSYFMTDQKFVMVSTVIWSALVFAFIFIPACYVYQDGSRGFVAFTGVDSASGGNRLCPLALFSMTMVYLCMTLYQKKKMIICALPALYVFFMGGSRTYFAVGCALFVVLLYNFFEKKRFFYLLIIPIIVIGYIMVSYSTMGDRISNSTWNSESYGDFWYVLTSGRSVFWKKMLDGYWSQNIIHILVGNGYNFTTDVGSHWGHNDFVEILCSFGILGLGVYLWSIFSLLKTLLHKVKIPILIKILVLFVWGFNAFFNMFYTYICAALAFPILLITVAYEYSSMQENKTETLWLKK